MRLAWLSCIALRGDVICGHAIARLYPDVLISQGDAPYTNGSGTFWGYTTAIPDTSTTATDMLLKQTQQLAASGYSDAIARSRYFYYQPDDHEWTGDNWDHTITRAQASTPLDDPGPPTQAQVDAHFHAGHQACLDTIKNVSAFPLTITGTLGTYAVTGGLSPVKPSAADAGTAATNYQQLYFKQGFGFDGTAVGSSPDVELFFLDCMTSRDPLANTDDSSKYMISAAQEAQFIADINASTATYKIVCSTKKTYGDQTGDNTDTFGWEYKTQRSRIISLITATGVLWISGDKHVPHAIATYVANGDAYDHACVVACPAAVDLNTAPAVANEVIWVGNTQCFGWLDIDSDRISIEIKDVLGRNMQTFTLLPGSNVINAIAQPASSAVYARLPGAITDYFSTPDSVAASITDTLDIRVKVSLDDWTPTVQSTLVSKYETTGVDQRAYLFSVGTGGKLSLIFSPTGSSTVVSPLSTVSTGFSDGTTHWVRVQLFAALGVCYFSTSEDGVYWTMLGTPLTFTPTVVDDNNSALNIGVAGVGAFWPLAGDVYRAQIYNGDTLAVDFNPDSYVSGTTWTSDTSEVWTINGAASIA